MEEDYYINEIQAFKSKIANLQKGIREIKNNMTFLYVLLSFCNINKCISNKFIN